MADTTVESEGPKTETISPHGRKYKIIQVWVLDEKTLLPVGVREEIELES